jgi:hypothetical protein
MHLRKWSSLYFIFAPTLHTGDGALGSVPLCFFFRSLAWQYDRRFRSERHWAFTIIPWRPSELYAWTFSLNPIRSAFGRFPHLEDRRSMIYWRKEARRFSPTDEYKCTLWRDRGLCLFHYFRLSTFRSAEVQIWLLWSRNGNTGDSLIVVPKIASTPPPLALLGIRIWGCRHSPVICSVRLQHGVEDAGTEDTHSDP